MFVGFTDLLGSLILQQIIVAVTHRQAALIELDDIHRAVLLVRINEKRKEGAHTLFLELGDHTGHVRLCCQAIDPLQILLDRGITILIQFNAIQSHAIQQADLLAYASRLLRCLAQVVHKGSQLLLAVITQLVERAKTGILRFQGIILDPASTGITIKISTRRYGRIHIRGIDRGDSRRFTTLFSGAVATCQSDDSCRQ